MTIRWRREVGPEIRAVPDVKSHTEARSALHPRRRIITLQKDIDTRPDRDAAPRPPLETARRRALRVGVGVVAVILVILFATAYCGARVRRQYFDHLNKTRSANHSGVQTGG